MLKSAFEKLVRPSNIYESHDLIRLQSKVARLTKNFVEKALSDFNLSALQWSMIGVIKTHAEGVRYVEISQKMGVEAPFVTELIETLKRKGIIKISLDPKDKRAKVVNLSAKGSELAKNIEDKLKKEISKNIIDISSAEMKNYISTIRKIINLIEKQ